MPAFGKSGTWRIFSFSFSVVIAWTLSDVESCIAAGRAHVGDFDLLAASSGWAVPHVTREPLERCAFPFGGDLDPAVRTVDDPSMEPFTRGGGLHEHAEADALNPPADHITPRESHGGWRRDYIS